MSNDKSKVTPKKMTGVCCSVLLFKRITAVLHRLPYEEIAPLMNDIHEGFHPVTYTDPKA